MQHAGDEEQRPRKAECDEPCLTDHGCTPLGQTKRVGASRVEANANTPGASNSTTPPRKGRDTREWAGKGTGIPLKITVLSSFLRFTSQTLHSSAGQMSGPFAPFVTNGSGAIWLRPLLNNQGPPRSG